MLDNSNDNNSGEKKNTTNDQITDQNNENPEKTPPSLNKTDANAGKKKKNIKKAFLKSVKEIINEINNLKGMIMDQQKTIEHIKQENIRMMNTIGLYNNMLSDLINGENNANNDPNFSNTNSENRNSDSNSDNDSEEEEENDDDDSDDS